MHHLIDLNAESKKKMENVGAGLDRTTPKGMVKFGFVVNGKVHIGFHLFFSTEKLRMDFLSVIPATILGV